MRLPKNISKMQLLYFAGCFTASVLVLLSYHCLVESAEFPEPALLDTPPRNLGTTITPSSIERGGKKHASIVFSLEERILQMENRIRDLEKGSLIKSYPKVRELPLTDRKRVLVTGGAGFVGSHLVDRLMQAGYQVTVVDNFVTGSKRNVAHWLGHHNFELIHHDIVNPLFLEVDQIYSLASPASPRHYMLNPVKTIKTNTLGTINMLGLAKRVGARILVTSTSEVYGDPEVHPQPEEYWGHVNPIGPRSCYDEGKRVAEALCYAYAKQEKVEVRVARVFNTFGPRMHVNDGRVVSNFILQALKGHNITIYGSGQQTRSFQYVSDLIDGLVLLMNSNVTRPVNLGYPDEYTIAEFAHLIKDLVGNSQAQIVHLNQVADDPQRRKPDITRARTELKWSHQVELKEGLKQTIEYFRRQLKTASKPSADEEISKQVIEM